MFTALANHTITCHQDFAVVVPHPGSELTEATLVAFEQKFGQPPKRNFAIIFYPHPQYSIRFCAMQYLMNLPDNIYIGVVSGSRHTRMVFDLLKQMNSQIKIFSSQVNAHHWLNQTTGLKT